ncbi:MAG: ATP-binding cassette domain-containing protein, partial [Terriglobia bacterium]
MRIELRDVCFSYGKGAAGGAVLDHVSFAVRDGDFLGIVGRTGSGKSTLVQ